MSNDPKSHDDIKDELICHLLDENRVLKERVIYWETFFSETIRLFGETTSELGSGLKKAHKILSLSCRAKAKDAMKEDKPAKKQGGFNVDKFMKFADIETKKAFGKKTLRSIHLEYLLLTTELPDELKRVQEITTSVRPVVLSKIDALNYLKEKHGYPGKLSSFLKLLEKNSTIPKETLPSRRTIEDTED